MNTIRSCYTDPALTSMITALPKRIGGMLARHPRRHEITEIALDLNRVPDVRFRGAPGSVCVDHHPPITAQDLEELAIGRFTSDNRAGIPGTLHRVSAMRNVHGDIVGVTCRVGRAWTDALDALESGIVYSSESVLFLGPPASGKTSMVRELARQVSETSRVIIVDTSNEIAGDLDAPHLAVGRARRMHVPHRTLQHAVMIEAVQNHSPEVVIVDEIGTPQEAMACRTIAERGVRLVATAHGNTLANVVQNPVLRDLVGGIAAVTLGDAAARGRNKTVLERVREPVFEWVVEIHPTGVLTVHSTATAVDALLKTR